MDLLMDGTARSVIHRHRLAHPIHKTTFQRHFLTRTGTAWHGPEATHNLKPDRTAPSRLGALEWRKMTFDPVPTATSRRNLKVDTLDTAGFRRFLGPVLRGEQ